MENFIYDYFIEPILSRTGYNVVNTLTYAIIAMVCLYLIFNFFKMRKISVDKNFVVATLCFVLLGSTVRVVTDSIDTGVFKPITPIHAFIVGSHIYDYGFLTVSPGIYVVIAFVFLLFVVSLSSINKLDELWKIGIALWLPHFLLILPFLAYVPFALLIIVLAAIPFFAARFFIRDDMLSLIVGAHALDGAATFVAIEVLPKFAPISYFEQHVVSSHIGILTGSYLFFYLLKIAISFSAAWLLSKEKMDEQEKNYVALVVIIMGLAPGLRDLLRLAIGA
jgi:uncharacterized membrane protein